MVGLSRAHTIARIETVFNPSIALLISIAAILILARLKVPVGFSVLAGCAVLILFVIPIKSVASLLLQTLENKQTWQLLIVVPCTMAFGSLMEQKGMLTKLAATLEGIGPRLAVHLLPAVIGLVAMPAGALVAATAVKSLAERLRLTPARITFINYWFRHIWEFSLPLYPAIIVTSTILAIPISTVVKTLLPITALATFLGTIFSYQIIRKTPRLAREPRDKIKNIITAFGKTAWPILLLIALIFFKVEPWIIFPTVLILVAIQQRVNWQELKKALKYGLNPLIILLLFAVLLYQMTAKNSNAAGILVSDMRSIGLPPLVMLAGMPLLIGIAIGYGPAITGITLPLLSPYIVTSSGLQSGALLLAYVSGMVGQLISPAHLCFCLSAEYFKTTLGSVYRYTLPALVVIEVIVIIIFLFLN